MLSTSETAASTSAKDSDGVLNERLESMKGTRSGLIGHVTKLHGELESLMIDSSQYETASKKKFELEAISRCLEHARSYLDSVRNTAGYREQGIEAQSKYSESQKRKIVYEDEFQAYVQRCTDGDPSASEIDDTASKASSASSIKRKRELIALRKARRELEVMAIEAKLQLRLAELDAKEENLILDEEQSQISGRKRDSHRSNTSIKKCAKPLPNVSQTLPTVSQPTFTSSNPTNTKDIGHTMYSKPATQPTPNLFEVPNLSSKAMLQPAISPLILHLLSL